MARRNREARLSDEAQAQLDAIVKWLADNAFPYNWHSAIPAPAFLRAPLAAEYAERDGDDPERHLETLDWDQEWR